MKLLLWHVHGAWTTAFVHGAHDYVVPVLPGRGPDGRGRARTYAWPDGVRELAPEQLREEAFDVVILQRPHEEALLESWCGAPSTGARVYVEHNAPQGRIAEMRHPMADREDLLIAHVTHFNDLMWDAGATPTTIVEHGIVDPGYRYTGELPRAAVVVNEARRRGRVTGTDLLARFAAAAPVDVFGMDAGAVAGAGVTGVEDLPQDALHTEMARRRAYLHPIRWTSLGLSLIEAMHLGMPVVALGTTEAYEAVPAHAGVVSTDVGRLCDALAALTADPFAAAERGAAARAAALERYGLARFHRDWDALLAEVAPEAAPAHQRSAAELASARP